MNRSQDIHRFAPKGGGWPCPGCGAKLDCAGGLGGREPRPGDLAICMHCARPAVFGVSGFRAMAEAEVEEACANAQFAGALDWVRRHVAGRN